MEVERVATVLPSDVTRIEASQGWEVEMERVARR
jgi:hypothetical protein